MKARWLVLIVLASTGCVSDSIRGGREWSANGYDVGPPAKTPRPVTPDMVTEENGHRISQELLDELDREGR